MKIPYKKILLGIFFLIFLALEIVPVFAAGVCEPCDGETCDSGLECVDGVCTEPGTIIFCSPIKTKSFEDLIKSIIDFIFKIVLVIAPLMIVIAGFLFVTAGGNSEQVNKAKKVILFTSIGLFVVFLSNGLVALIRQIFEGGAPPSGEVETPPINNSPINNPPIADAGGPYQSFTNVEISFNGSGSSDPDNDSLIYAWDFGDGTQGSGIFPQHTYSQAKAYTVTLIVNDGKENSQPSTTQIVVSELPPTLSSVLSNYYTLGTSYIAPEEIFHFNPEQNSGWFYVAQTIPENGIAFWAAAVRSISTNSTDTSAQLLYGITNTNTGEYYPGFLNGGSFFESSDEVNLFYQKNGKKLVEFKQKGKDLSKFELKVNLPWNGDSLQTTKTLTLSRPVLYESGDGIIPISEGVDSLYASMITDQGFWIDFQKFNIVSPSQATSRFEANHRWGSFVLNKKVGILPAGTAGIAWEILDQNNQRQPGGYTNVDLLVPGLPQFTAKKAQIEMGEIEEIEHWDSGHKTYLKRWKMSYPGGVELLFETVIPDQENELIGNYFYEGMIKVINPKTGEVVGTGMLEQTHNEASD